MVELALVGEKSPVSRPIFEEREELLAERLRPPLLLCRLHDLVERDVHLARAGVLVDGEEVVGEHDQATLVKQLGTGIFFFLNGVCVYKQQCKKCKGAIHSVLYQNSKDQNSKYHNRELINLYQLRNRLLLPLNNCLY